MIYINCECFNNDCGIKDNVEAEIYNAAIDYVSAIDNLADINVEDILAGFIEDEIYFEDDYTNYDEFKSAWLPDFRTIVNSLLKQH